MKSIIYGILGFMVLIASCDKPEQLGPDIKGIYGPLNITQPFASSTSTVDFSTGASVYFTAQFENDAIWTITIVGATSGATKTITGISKTIAANNSTWTGYADDAPSFQVENVTATLSFANSTNTYPLAITVSGVKNLDAGGVLVTNFSTSKVANGNHTSLPLWRSDWNTTATANTFGMPDGNNYLIMSGTPWDHQPAVTGDVTPYIDYMTIFTEGADVAYGPYFPLYADPTKVYFNIMVYNTGLANSRLRIVFLEENASGKLRCVPPTCTMESDQRYVDIIPNWTGWKQLSFNYSQTTPGVLNAAPKPTKIGAIQFILFSDASQAVRNAGTESVGVAFDHLIFTHNKPYQP